MTVQLPHGLAAKLRREARRAGREDFLEVLLAEAVARRWFLRHGLPCWRTGQSPGSRGRYGLVFASGRRALVSPEGFSGYSFDSMAAGRCHYLLKVSMKSGTSGEPEGFFELFDVRKPGELDWRPDLMMLEVRPMDEFPELDRRPANFRRSYILGSLKLLLLSELKVPPPSE
jgi:hypothetical protein